MILSFIYILVLLQTDAMSVPDWRTEDPIYADSMKHLVSHMLPVSTIVMNMIIGTQNYAKIGTLEKTPKVSLENTKNLSIHRAFELTK